MSAPTPDTVPGPVRDLLAAIVETLDLPVPAPEAAAAAVHQGILDDRVQYVRLAIDAILTGTAHEGIEWEAQFLRTQAAKRPPTYRTRAQFDDDRRATAATPVDPGVKAAPPTATELLAEAATEYAAAEAQRRAGDQPPGLPDLTALAAESAEASKGPDAEPA